MAQHDPTDLVVRYVGAFESQLPKAQRADVVAEFSDGVQSRIEEREAELGRPLTVDEQSAILKAYGPPTIAASRYWPQQQLIGPLLLPYYWRTLRIALWTALALNIADVIVIGLTTDNGFAAFARFWGTAVVSLMAVVGGVTIVYALLERYAKSDAFVRNWDPRTLRAVHEGPTVPRATSAVEFAFNALFALWLLDVPYVRNFVALLFTGKGGRYAGDLPLGLAPVWSWGILALVVSLLVGAAMNVANLIRPDWTRLRAGTLAATNGLVAIVAFLIARTKPLVLATSNAQHLPSADALRIANDTLFWGLIIVGVYCLVATFVYLRQLLRPISAPTKTDATIALA